MDAEDLEAWRVEEGIGYYNPDKGGLFEWGTDPNSYRYDGAGEAEAAIGAFFSDCPFSDSQLADPDSVIQQWGWYEALNYYRKNVAYFFTNDYSCGYGDGPRIYPRDWRWRRIWVWAREWERKKLFDGYREWAACEKCGKLLALKPIFSRGELRWHAHHEPPISKGGNHDLDHLHLWCVGCHKWRHPWM